MRQMTSPAGVEFTLSYFDGEFRLLEHQKRKTNALRGYIMFDSTGRAVRSAARALAVTLVLLAASAAAHAGLLTFNSIAGDTNAQIAFIQGQTGTFLQTTCPGCVTVTSPAAAAGTYDISVDGFNIGPINFVPTPPQQAVYSQSFQGDIEISISSGASVLVGGSCSTFTIFAEPGASNAVFQCQITPTGANVVTFPSGPLYLIFAGSTAAAVSTTTSSIPVAPFNVTSFNGMTLDWNGTLSTTPYSPQGVNPVTVPPLTGDTQATAVSTLTAFGLTTGTVTTQSSATVAAGIVLSQNPTAGATVPAGWSVDLVVSSGPPLVAVPNLLVPSTTEAAAIAAIQGAGLKVTTVTSIPSSSIPAGTVTAQSPAAGTMVALNTAVTFTISSGVATATPTINYSGDGFSSFNYTLYPGSASFVEAFINPEENGGSTLYSAFGGAGGFDANNSPALFIENYVDQTTPVVCATGSQCAQPVNGAGTLLIYNVGSCPAGSSGPQISTVQCDWTEGKLGAGFIYAGNSLADLNNNLVNTATFQLSFTPTESFSAATGLTTLTPAAAAAYFIVSGASAVTAPGAAPVPGPVQVCYLPTQGQQCGPLGQTGFFGVFTIGPYFQEFGIDWTAKLTATPFTPPTDSISVPNVVGDSQSVATAALVGAGLTAGSVSTESSTTVSVGTVLSESPLAGTAVTAGTAVNLTVSSGPPQVVVPNVTGETQAAASSALTTAGLVLGTVTTASSILVAAGNVISESPVAGSSVAAGLAVSLTISSGPMRGDINADGQVNKLDLALITSALNTPASGPNDPRDLNHDGVINILDARILVTLCTNPGCAIN
jgi:beta-lactam-binding protein with PASTA domain